ncbi:heterogeneous nuclear ribonucleoprotein A1 [Octopus bimaculoides]|uniref:RRM domain-containing protein n=1 Tax=Octopus bimaculoides TaxID=37653 RepID=A0A0L8FQW3_OCTBM|nr:heterogeneous nuclear ribonucleoprotein A1 [Octopus bimaculoides]|eukprot:XP_014787730.1 PREDICTED: heterogeneous nuclear ribonucleoprotein A1-like [Octopus bimaculoides]
MTMTSNSDEEKFCKLFVARLSSDTSEESLKNYFQTWGEVSKCVIVKNPSTNQSKGFAFVTFVCPEALDKVQEARPHCIDNRKLDTKRAIPQDEAPENKVSVSKMFVGGIKEDSTEDEIRNTFSPYGEIEKIDMIRDKGTGKFKRFCFVTFTDYDSVDKCVIKKHFELSGKQVEVKKAVSKDELITGRGGSGVAAYSRVLNPYGRGAFQGYGSPYGYGGASAGWYAYPGGIANYTSDAYGTNFSCPYGNGLGGGPTRGRGSFTPRGSGPYGGW